MIDALNGKFSRNRSGGGDIRLREEAAEALGNIGDEGAIEPLEKVLKSNPSPSLKYRTEKALEKIKKQTK